MWLQSGETAPDNKPEPQAGNTRRTIIQQAGEFENLCVSVNSSPPLVITLLRRVWKRLFLSHTNFNILQLYVSVVVFFIHFSGTDTGS